MLGAGALLAALLARMPALATWSERALIVLLLGLGAYGASAVVVARWPPTAPELRRLRAARREIGRLLNIDASRIDDQVYYGGWSHEWESLGIEAMNRLNEEIAPAL